MSSDSSSDSETNTPEKQKQRTGMNTDYRSCSKLPLVQQKNCKSTDEKIKEIERSITKLDIQMQDVMSSAQEIRMFYKKN